MRHRLAILLAGAVIGIGLGVVAAIDYLVSPPGVSGLESRASPFLALPERALPSAKPRPAPASDRRDGGELLQLSPWLLAGVSLIAALLFHRRYRRCLGQLVAGTEAIGRAERTTELPPARHGDAATLPNNRGRQQAGLLRARQRTLAERKLTLESGIFESSRTPQAYQLASAHEQALECRVLEDLADGVVAIDQDGRLLLWNRRAESLLGPAPEALSPDGWAEHIGLCRDKGGETIPAPELPLLRALRGEANDAGPLYRPAPNDAGHWLQVSGRPLRDDQGQVIGAVMTLSDITALQHEQSRQRQHRAELAKVGRLALFGELAALVSHQLSQPVTAIANYAGAALQLQRTGRLDNARINEILSHITRLVDRAGANLQGIRTITQQRDPTPTDVDLNSVLDSCLQLVDGRLIYAKVQLEVDRAKGLPLVHGDLLALEQVLVHLIMNAIDAVSDQPADERTVALRTRYLTDPPRALVIVQDSGKGLSRTAAQDIFEPWVTTKANSLGIGLSIVRTIVEGHNGRVWLESCGENGTAFHLELPATEHLAT